MPNYRRLGIDGSIFFFTVVLADRSSRLLIDEIERLRRAYRTVQERRPFETIAICILPDHIHAVWALSEGDKDFATRWSLIKGGFSRGLEARPRSRSKLLKREKGIWQRRYWKHAIRDAGDLERHVNYIHFNPVQHGYVTRRSRLASQQLSWFCETWIAPGGLGGPQGYRRGFWRVIGGHASLCPPYSECSESAPISVCAKNFPTESVIARSESEQAILPACV